MFYVNPRAGISAFADRHNCTDLVKSSESFARHHFIDVVQSEEFMEISAKQISRLLSDDDLNIQSEERVFEAALAWIKYDIDVRQVVKIVISVNFLSSFCNLHRACLQFITVSFEGSQINILSNIDIPLFFCSGICLRNPWQCQVSSAVSRIFNGQSSNRGDYKK